MIRLQDLITEISLGGVTPYATQFTWDRSDAWRETKFVADGFTITLAMVPLGVFDAGPNWGFAILTPTADGHGATVSHSRSAAAGRVNYLRLMSTVAEALIDFATQWQPESIDVTGSDTSSTAKDLQKTRIYRSLLAANAARLETAGYTVLDKSGKLFIVRKNTADATGIADE
jgi:hypothetical protein